MVAVGNEGILVRNENGDWLRQPLLNATPTPLWTLNLIVMPLMFHQEEIILFIVTVLTLIGLVIIARRLLWPHVLTVFAFVLAGVPLTVFLALLADDFFSIILGIGAILLVLVVARWKRQLPDTVTREAIWVWLSIGIGILIVGNVPLVLWMTSIIPVYEWALVVSAISILALIGLTGRHLLRLSKPPT